MSAYKAPFDLFEDLNKLLPESYRIVVPRQVLKELSELARGGGRAAAAARVALQLSKRLEVLEIKADRADDAILKMAEELGRCAVVCTNDSELKNILKARGIRVIGVRDYSHLSFL